MGSSLVGWWLGFQAFTAMAQVQSLVRELETLQALWYNNNKNIYVYTQDLSVTLNHNRKDKQLFKKQQQQQQKKTAWQ